MWSMRGKQVKIVEHNSVDGLNLLKYRYKIVALISSEDETIDTQYVDENYFETFKNYVETIRF
jgi:hypothetical protein